MPSWGKNKLIVMRLGIFWIILVFGLGCTSAKKEVADLIIINAQVATVDSLLPDAEAVAVKGDRILQVGNNDEIQALQGEHTEVIDAGGQFLMPGFIEGHGHFSGLGQSLMILNFMQVKNWDEIVNMVAEAAKKAQPGEWIIGRGWHQEKWTGPLDKNVLGYPYHDKLSAVSPDNPVMLRHASGHSLFANAKAMEMAGVSKETANPFGGEIVRDASGQAIGVFEETAMGLIGKVYDDYLQTVSTAEKYQYWLKGIRLAEEDCLRKGVTSFQDAGADLAEVDDYIGLAEKDSLNVRLWLMMKDDYETMAARIKEFPKTNVGGQEFLTIRAIKGVVDGALGAFGALLLQPYADKPGFSGQNTFRLEDLKKVADMAIGQGIQFCIHAIGDRANRMILDLYEQTFAVNSDKKDVRWRIEHAQHIDTADMPRFKQWNIIASMQGIHCTSDAPFVEKRLGPFRARYTSYPWRSLLDLGVVIANGTDAPVEDVDPIPSFYASVTRKRADTGMEFYPEQKMTRTEALYSYTLGNAYAGFEEQNKGSIIPGKLADLVLLSKNLLTCSDEEILQAQVVKTIVGGKVKYDRAD